MTATEHRKKVYWEWRCQACQSLLGLHFPVGVLHVKFKDLVMYVKGEATIVCRKCGTTNTMKTDINVESFTGS